jgi:hypothetical protein
MDDRLRGLALMKSLLTQRIDYADSRIKSASEEGDEITVNQFFGEWRGCRIALQWIEELPPQIQYDESMRSDVIEIAAACARFQHFNVEDLEQEDLRQFGDYANKLKSVADRMIVR